MKAIIKNQLNGKLAIEFCVGDKEYQLAPDEEITIDVEEDDCVYFDTVYAKKGEEKNHVI
jgi:hypothetical protein